MSDSLQPVNSSMPGFPVQNQLLGLVQTHVHEVGDAIRPSHPLSSPSPPVSILLSIKVFPNESLLCIKWPKYWSFNFNISPSNEYSMLIFFRVDWFDLLAVQGTLKSLFQHHSSKAYSSALSFICGPTLTLIHNYWKNYSFHYRDLCWQSNVIYINIHTCVCIYIYIYIYIYAFICIFLKHFPITLQPF